MSYKKKYTSVFGARGLIDAPNYLAEQILLKRANQKDIKLPDGFWRKQYSHNVMYKYWYSVYPGEVIKAKAILSKYDEDCVIQALNHPECKVILSLHNEKLERIARELQKKKELAEQNKEEVELNIVSPNTLPRKRLGNKSKLGKLK